MPHSSGFRGPRLDPELDYFLTVLRTRPEAAGPYVVQPPGRPDGDVLFVGRKEVIRLPASIGYASYAPTVRAITLVHGGVTGADSAAAASELVDTLRAALAAGEADVVILPSLRPGSALHEAAGRVPFAQRDHLPATTTHRTLRLPDSYEEFVRTRSKKHEGEHQALPEPAPARARRRALAHALRPARPS